MSARNRGMALIQALLIVAALAAVATALLIRAERARERLEWRFAADQAALYLDSGVELLRASLPRGPVHPAQDWAEPREGVEIDRGRLDWTVTDLRGRFNLNLLRGSASGPYRDAFLALATGAGVPREQAIDTLARSLPEGEAFDAATVLTLGHHLGDDRDHEAWDRVTDLVWAWPLDEGMNLNTLPEGTLALLLPGFDSLALGSLRAQLEAEPEGSLEDLLDWAAGALSEEQSMALEDLPLSRSSTQFRVQMAARLDTLTLRRSVILDTGGPDGVSRVVMSIPGY